MFGILMAQVFLLQFPFLCSNQERWLQLTEITKRKNLKSVKNIKTKKFNAQLSMDSYGYYSDKCLEYLVFVVVRGVSLASFLF